MLDALDQIGDLGLARKAIADGDVRGGGHREATMSGGAPGSTARIHSGADGQIGYHAIQS
jgi:hypothetical protein